MTAKKVKGPRFRRPFSLFDLCWVSLQTADVLGLQPFGALLHLELHFRALVKRTITVRLDGRKMDEYIVTAVALDETIALGGVKPLHNTFFSHFVFLLDPRCFA